MRGSIPAATDSLRSNTSPTTPGTNIDWPMLAQSLAQKQVQLALKRVFDAIGAMLALLLLSPLLLLIAVLVRISSPGPIFFRQSREGYLGKPFTIYKFRSLHVSSDPDLVALQEKAAAQGILVKLKRDPRVTPIGHFLRSTSLDELPQLFNILKGEMSFVGPRPLVSFMLQPFPEFARARQWVRPGVTGLWQVRERHNNTSALPMMAHDLEYMERFGLWLDLAILLKTPRVVLSGQGAF